MASPKNFCGIPKKFSSYDSAKIVVVPVQFDGTSTWVKGADKGPDALIHASLNMELYDIETDSEPYLNGIHTDKPIKEKAVEKMVKAVKERVSTHIKQKKFVVLIGGEHSVSVGSIQAHGNAFRNLTVLHLDAHTDLREKYQGSKFSHASTMARAKEVCPVISIGIRSTDIEEKKYFNPEDVFFAKDIQKGNEWMDEVISRLSQNVYISFDLDALDPAIMPSTGTPEPGGMQWYPVLEFLRKVAEQRNIVGFDVVELCPNKADKAPDFLAAKLVYTLLAYKFELNKK